MALHFEPRLRNCERCPYTAASMNANHFSRRENLRKAQSESTLSLDLRSSMMSMPWRPRSAEDGV
jgi:hypothetical protein